MLKATQIEVTILRNGEDVPLRDACIERVVCEVLAQSNVQFAQNARIIVAIVFVSDDEIHALNHRYRYKDAPTDVLSFPEDFAAENAPGVDRINEEGILDGAINLGDIVLSCATIRRYATMDGVAFEQSLIFVIAHGILHLLGYNHSRMMFAIQDAVTEKLYGVQSDSCAELA